MWERDLKGFADDYNFVSLHFNSEATESVVPEEATTAKASNFIKYFIKYFLEFFFYILFIICFMTY